MRATSRLLASSRRPSPPSPPRCAQADLPLPTNHRSLTAQSPAISRVHCRPRCRPRCTQLDPKLRVIGGARPPLPSMAFAQPSAEDSPAVLATLTSRPTRAAMAFTWIAFSVYVAAFSPGAFSDPADTKVCVDASTPLISPANLPPISRSQAAYFLPTFCLSTYPRSPTTPSPPTPPPPADHRRHRRPHKPQPHLLRHLQCACMRAASLLASPLHLPCISLASPLHLLASLCKLSVFWHKAHSTHSQHIHHSDQPLRRSLRWYERASSQPLTWRSSSPDQRTRSHSPPPPSSVPPLLWATAPLAPTSHYASRAPR